MSTAFEDGQRALVYIAEGELVRFVQKVQLQLATLLFSTDVVPGRADLHFPRAYMSERL